MKNVLIKNEINKLNKNTQLILDLLISDAILEINCRNRIREDTLNRIVLTYLSLFGKENFLEYDELSLPERNVICRIISKGIASIYVDDEYLNIANAKEKLIIIDDMINFLCLLTDLNRSSIKRLVRKDIKLYFYRGWRWEFI